MKRIDVLTVAALALFLTASNVIPREVGTFDLRDIQPRATGEAQPIPNAEDMVGISLENSYSIRATSVLGNVVVTGSNFGSR